MFPSHVLDVRAMCGHTSTPTNVFILSKAQPAPADAEDRCGGRSFHILVIEVLGWARGMRTVSEESQ
jgi:hypothetical protein